MPIENETFLIALADMLLADEIETLAEYFIFPMPCYSEEDLQVFRTKEAFVAAQTLYKEAIVASGVVKLVPRIVAHGLPLRDYSNVWVEWDHLDREHHPLLTSQVRYVLHHAAGACFPKIELVEYKFRAYPELSKGVPIPVAARPMACKTKPSM